MKNYKREDKEAVCRVLQRRGLAGKAHHQVMIRGQPAKVGRILRHIQSSAVKSHLRGSDCPSMSIEDDQIEVCTPDSGTTLDDQSSLRSSGTDLLRRLSLTTNPSRPILTYDDMGKAEILCLESVRYFDTLLSSYACARSTTGSTRYKSPIVTVNHIYAASDFVQLERYVDARIMLNKAFDEFKDQIREQSPKLLPAILDATFCNDDSDQTPFMVRDLFFEHATDLCEIRLGVRHPITVVISIYRGVGGKAETCNAVFGSLLDVALRNAEHSESQDLLMYLMERKAEVLHELGRFREAERILQRALTICKSMQGTGHRWSLKVLNSIAWLKFEALQSCSEAKALFQNTLQSVEHKDMARTAGEKIGALAGLAWIAEKEHDLLKAESLHRQALDLALETWGAEDNQTIFRALLLEETLRARGNDIEADYLRNYFRLKDDSFI